MARIVERLYSPELVAYYRHDCGALVEFTQADIQPDQRDGAYVVCPCGKPPFIAASVLKWETRRYR